jgi:O-antigen/teichoic acid export membrane protein
MIFVVVCILESYSCLIKMTQQKGGNKLNIIGLTVIATAIIFLIYSIIRKNKVRVKFSDRFIIINEQKFLRLQLYCSILNSTCMIIFGIIIIADYIPSLYIISYPLLFHFINYLIIPIGRNKQYIRYNKKTC